MLKNNLTLNRIIVEKLTKLIKRIFDPKSIRSIYLIGSFARNEMTEYSDFDLLIISRKGSSYITRKNLLSLPEFYLLDSELLKSYSGGLQPFIIDEEVLKKEQSFIKAVLREGQLLQGEAISTYIVPENNSPLTDEKKDPNTFLNMLDEVEINF